MIAFRLDLAANAQIEIWARGTGEGGTGIEIRERGRVVHRIQDAPPHLGHYRYVHDRAGEVEIGWDPAVLELAFAYDYDPARVAEEGIALWHAAGGGIERVQGQALSDRMRDDPSRPRLHFSPPVGWMNDPNGLCRVGDTWHLFYQFHPHGTEWGPMHWGHASSRDLLSWTHLPVFLHPEQNLWRLGATGGAFSGTAFVDPSGGVEMFYTERLAAYSTITGYREVQKVARADAGLIRPIATEEVLSDRPAGVTFDFRDPKVWLGAGAQAYRMALGAAIDGDPAVLLYGSADRRNWHYVGPLYRAGARFGDNGARAAECPDFFELDGHWVLISGFVGYTEPGSGRRNLVHALVGDFDGVRFTPRTGLQTLDFGTDFYALQSARDGDRQVAIAWCFNWDGRKPAGASYSGEMSLPRELSLSEDLRLCMTPAREVEAALGERRMLDAARTRLEARPFDLRLDGMYDGAAVKARAGGTLAFRLSREQGRWRLDLPGDDGRTAYLSDPARGADLRLIHDTGLVEVFADGGAVCGTRRSHAPGAVDELEITGAGRATLAYFRC